MQFRAMTLLDRSENSLSPQELRRQFAVGHPSVWLVWRGAIPTYRASYGSTGCRTAPGPRWRALALH